MKPTKLGIIGCGNVMGAYLRLIEQLQIRGVAELVAICGRQRHRDRVTRECGVSAFFTEPQDLIDAPNVELVIILTPMTTHARLVRGALLAGKHVLVEKPLATTLEEATELVQLARGSPALLVCAPFTWLSPTFQAISRHLQNDDVGRIVLARGRYGWAGPDWAEWFYRPGGGPMFDLAVYNISTLTAWLGPVRQVAAMTGTAIPDRMINGRTIRVETDDNLQILLDFGNACFATVTSGFTIQQYRGPALELYGTAGTIQMLGDDWNPHGYEIWRNSEGCWQVFNETQPDWPWTDGLSHLVECIRGGIRPRVSPEHSLHVLEVMLRAQEASRAGRTIEVHSDFAPPEFQKVRPQASAHRVHDRTRQ